MTAILSVFPAIDSSTTSSTTTELWNTAALAIGERPFSRMTKGVREPARYKVPPVWRPIALRKTSKGLETERRPGKEKEQVMTADEIIVGIDDSPPARAGLRWAAAYARSTGTALRAIHVVD